jgi:hypothetical protein
MPIEREHASDQAAGPPRWVRWRTERLVRLGLPAELADRLAQESQVDVHALLELVDRGCPPRLAARICAPLEWDPRWP